MTIRASSFLDAAAAFSRRPLGAVLYREVAASSSEPSPDFSKKTTAALAEFVLLLRDVPALREVHSDDADKLRWFFDEAHRILALRALDQEKKP